MIWILTLFISYYYNLLTASITVYETIQPTFSHLNIRFMRIRIQPFFLNDDPDPTHNIFQVFLYNTVYVLTEQGRGLWAQYMINIYKKSLLGPRILSLAQKVWNTKTIYNGFYILTEQGRGFWAQYDKYLQKLSSWAQNSLLSLKKCEIQKLLLHVLRVQESRFQYSV